MTSALAGSLALSPGYAFGRDTRDTAVPKWPNDSAWSQLNKEVMGRLVKPESPWSTIAQNNVPDNLKNPWYLEERVGATQSTGLFQAWTSTPSAYATAAETVEDIVAGVIFARTHGVRLVVKGTGHDYFGRSCAPNGTIIEELLEVSPMNNTVVKYGVGGCSVCDQAQLCV